MRFEYWQSGDGSWSWHLKTSIDEILASGRTYTSRENCLAAIKLVKLAAGAPHTDVSRSALELTKVPSNHVRFRVQPV